MTTDVQESALDHARRLLYRHAWYLGRVQGLVKIAEWETPAQVVADLRKIIADYEKEREEMDSYGKHE